MLNSAPEPLSLCTLPLNEGNCTADPSKPASSPGSGSLAAAFARKRFYFNKEESKCMEFTHQVSSNLEFSRLLKISYLKIRLTLKMRFPLKIIFKRCGGNSNNFESEMHCTATCLKAMFNI